jgi:hypothetical protein
MTCPDALKLMAYLDGELEPFEAESVRLHLSQCQECARRLESQRRLESAWRDSWRDPPDFRFLAMRDSVDRRARKPRGVPGWLIGAAAGAGAVFLGIRIFLGPGHGDLEERIRSETVPAAAQEPVSEPLEESVAEMPADSLHLDQSMADTRSAESADARVNASGETGFQSADGAPYGQVPAGRTLGGAQTVPEQAEETQPVQGLIGDLDETPGCGFYRDAATEDLEQDTPGESESPAPVQLGGEGSGDDRAMEITVIAAEAGAGGGGLSGASFAASSSAMAEEQHQENGELSRVRAAKSFILSCTGPGGVDVRPWDLLTAFVDSLLQNRGWVPPVFQLDSLGFTVEQEGIPRADLGVDDPARVPLTVRVTTF